MTAVKINVKLKYKNESLLICFTKTKTRERKWLNVEKRKKVSRKKLKKEEEDKLDLLKELRPPLIIFRGGRFFYTGAGIVLSTLSRRFKALSIFILAFSPKITSNSDFNLS